jgi:hypothetical protein
VLREETLRYLKHSSQELTSEQNELVDASIDEVRSYADPRIIHRIFDLQDKNGLLGIDAEIDLHFPDLQKLLTGCGQCMLIAGTLGIKLDQRMRYYSRMDMVRYVIMDAAGSALIEEACDKYQAELPFSKFTFRFAPGYGDVPLTIQKQLLSVLETRKRIGLTLLPSMLMVPMKSISGIVGIGQEDAKRTCNGCKMVDHCEFRRNNAVCYQTN